MSSIIELAEEILEDFNPAFPSSCCASKAIQLAQIAKAKQEQREKDAILAENICHGIPVCGIENWEIAEMIAKAIRKE